MLNKHLSLITLIILLLGCSNTNKNHTEQLLRQDFISQVDGTKRQYFVYLPKGYNKSQKEWPVMLFLHGNGERGNGQDELDYIITHGPLYEAWIQKRDLPFIIVAPQLPMFGWDKQGIGYIDNRQLTDIPQRQVVGTPNRPNTFKSSNPISRTPSANNMDDIAPLLPQGWDYIESDLLNIIDTVQTNFNTDKSRLYLTGLSYGGFGTWYMASKHPQKFAAIAPIVGWGHPSLMAPIAEHHIPLWAFAAGRDSSINIKYFYLGINTLEQLGHSNVRFTVHEDMEHDAWRRVFAGNDIYQWLLSHSK